jgi:cytosine/adenosine deaminase-related metal-dependent hydrolase
MTILYSARWVLPNSSSSIEDGAIAIDGSLITDAGTRASLVDKYSEATVHHYPDAAILPGLINAHSHLELTAMRGFLESEEADFTSWLKKLTVARLELMAPDDRYVSAAWGAIEAARAGVTALADASDGAQESMKALIDVGLRGIVFQESFGPDPRMADDNFAKLTAQVAQLAELETSLVRVGVSPHAPYTVCGRLLELISEFALANNVPVMMHAAESVAEEMLLRKGEGTFAEALAKRGIAWHSPGLSTIQYLKRYGVLDTKPLLAHCIRVDDADIDTLNESGARIAHCPKSNAKLGHGRAPFASFLDRGIAVGLGSDSVASNNTCDILEEARFATLTARLESGDQGRGTMLTAKDALHAATAGGARALGLEGHTGELRIGLQADFAVVSLAGPHQQPSYDPINTLVFSSSGRDVLLTMVAGREVFSAGKVTTVDEERLAPRMKEIAVKLGAANSGK